MPDEILKVTIGKFTFLIPKGRFYSDAHVWVKLEGSRGGNSGLSTMPRRY